MSIWFPEPPVQHNVFFPPRQGIPAQPTIGDTNKYKSERERLKSFYSNGNCIWPKSDQIKAEEIANSGFYYLGDEDRVFCPWCRLILRDWSRGDQGMSEHKRHSPQCEFVLQPDFCGNVPLDHSRIPSAPSACRSGPRHTQYASVQARLDTYAQWPPSNNQSPQRLAECGLFYAGKGDQVRCFYCDIGLRDWLVEDDPWTEHGRHSSSCGFVLQQKGQHFIDRATGKTTSQQPQPSTSAANQSQDFSALASAKKDSNIVKVVLDMGYEWSLVKEVIEFNLKKGKDFTGSADLMEAVFDYESMAQVKVSESREPTPSSSTASDQRTPEVAHKDSTRALEEEIEQLKEQQICKICMDEKVAIVFVPCGHMCTCISCSGKVNTCPICRLAITRRVRAFLP